MRNRFGIAILVALGAAVLSGCRQDMHDQPKYKPQRPSDFFADGRSGRPPVENGVARGTLNEDTAFYTGKEDGKDVEVFPVAVDRALIERGRDRFDIYCSVCHGKIGNGLGMIVRRGFKQPPSYHIERLRTAPAGHFYDVISNGYGAMWNYAAQISPRDRWAIVAYVRVLQYSQNANINDLPEETRTKFASLEKHPAAGPGPAQPLVPDNKDIPAVREPNLPAGVPGASGAGAKKSNRTEKKKAPNREKTPASPAATPPPLQQEE